jgi:hypothetical protein
MYALLKNPSPRFLVVSVLLIFIIFIFFFFFFVFILCFVYPMLPVSLDCPFLIVTFGFLLRLFNGG